MQDSDDDMSDFEPQVMARRRMAERAAGEDVEYDEDDVDFALEDFGDVPLSEWLAQDRPRAEIKKRKCIAYMESTVVIVIVIFISWFLF